MRDLNSIRNALEKGSKGILVVQTAFLGDVILLLPLLQAIKTIFPAAPLNTLVIPACEGIVAQLSDRVLCIDKKDSNQDKWEHLSKEIVSLNIGAAFLPHRSLRSGRLVRDAEIPVRIGFARGGGRFFHSHTVEYVAGIYEGQRNLTLLRPFTDRIFNPLPSLETTFDAKTNIEKLLENLGLARSQFIVIAPGSVWNTKAWPVEHYQSLCRLLQNKFGLAVIAVGGKEDIVTCASSILEPSNNLAGQLSPLESSALMSYSRVVVSGDSAAAHLATAVGSRQIIVFGSTAPRYGFSPPTNNARSIGLDMACRPCTDHGRQQCPCFKSVRCLENLTPEAVLDAMSDWLTLND